MWGSHARAVHAEHANESVAPVDRPNFGLCLDTFQITGREWADPSEPDGLLAGFASAEERNAALTKSLNELSTTIPGELRLVLR